MGCNFQEVMKKDIVASTFFSLGLLSLGRSQDEGEASQVPSVPKLRRYSLSRSRKCVHAH